MASAKVELSPQDRARIGIWVRGKYHLDRVLGVGGMATVYSATHRNKKRFAVKLLHADLSRNAEVQRRFLREGYVANTVEHPGAVAVLDDDVAEDGSAFLVMELLDGESLEQIAERTPRLPLRVVLSIAHQLLGVLAAAHEKNVVHRDIKPANIFLTREGQVKVLDFGIARLRDGQESASATRTGMALGTPAFMAPEQALGKSSLIDARTDLWAVGATVFTLLSGRLVHEGETAQEQMVFAATRPAPSLAVAIEGAPPRVVEIVDRALAFDRGARWATAAAMRDAVRDVHMEIFSAGVSAGSLVAEVVTPAGEPRATPSFLAPTEQAVVDTASLQARRSGASGTASPVRPRRAGRIVLFVGGSAVAAGLTGAGWLARRASSPVAPAVIPVAQEPAIASDAAVAIAVAIAIAPAPADTVAPQPPTTSEEPPSHASSSSTSLTARTSKPRPAAAATSASMRTPLVDAAASATSLRACHEPLGRDCGPSEYCRFERGDACGQVPGDYSGVCRPRPRSCKEAGPIVCACDDKPYENRCTAWKSGISVRHEGACP